MNHGQRVYVGVVRRRIGRNESQHMFSRRQRSKTSFEHQSLLLSQCTNIGLKFNTLNPYVAKFSHSHQASHALQGMNLKDIASLGQ